MGFVKLLFLYSKLYSFEYLAKIKKKTLFTKPNINEGLPGKQGYYLY